MREAPSQVLSNPTMQDLLAQVVKTLLELHKRVMQVMEAQMNMQKSLTNVQQVVTALCLRKEELGKVKPCSTQPPSGKKCHRCEETRHFRTQCPRRRTQPDTTKKVFK